MEHSLQNQKALLFKDSDASRKIVQVSNPIQCRQVGRQVKNFNADKWFQDSPLILSEIAEAFYEQHSDLKKILLDTEEKTCFAEFVRSFGEQDCLCAKKLHLTHPNGKDRINLVIFWWPCVRNWIVHQSRL